MRISDWSSDVCSSDLHAAARIDDADAPWRVAVSPQRQHVAAHGDQGIADSVFGEDGLDFLRGGAFGDRAKVELNGAIGRADRAVGVDRHVADPRRSEEHTSELQSIMRISYAVFCLKKKKIE